MSWGHDYECSSPEKYRVFQETVYRMHNKSGLIVMNSLLVEEEHDNGISARMRAFSHEESTAA